MWLFTRTIQSSISRSCKKNHRYAAMCMMKNHHCIKKKKTKKTAWFVYLMGRGDICHRIVWPVNAEKRKKGERRPNRFKSLPWPQANVAIYSAWWNTVYLYNTQKVSHSLLTRGKGWEGNMTNASTGKEGDGAARQADLCCQRSQSTVFLLPWVRY